MHAIAIDLGGTKLALAVITEGGKIVSTDNVILGSRQGKEVGILICELISNTISDCRPMNIDIGAIGISVPGIVDPQDHTVWAPNIKGWEKYPLKEDISRVASDIPIIIDNDRACYIAGEAWQGVAKNCTDAIYMAVGTGIGAGIMVNGNILRGANDIAGAAGWMALNRPYEQQYKEYGCFEANASGNGIARLARKLLTAHPTYRGSLRNLDTEDITAHNIFDAYLKQDEIAIEVFRQCIELWGMAVANFISLFNPQKIILGGGVFGPAAQFLSAIRNEAAKWAQPVSMQKTTIEISTLGSNAGLYGAAMMGFKNVKNRNHNHVQ